VRSPAIASTLPPSAARSLRPPFNLHELGLERAARERALDAPIVVVFSASILAPICKEADDSRPMRVEESTKMGTLNRPAARERGRRGAT
jgi:hypothetical protein